MSTGLIIVIAIVVILAIIAIAMLASPKRREQRRLNAERDRAIEHHRGEARQREERADLADQRAQEARLEAERVEHEARMERERAQLHENRADLHQRGLADDELRREGDSTAATPANGRFDSGDYDRGRNDERQQFEEELATGRGEEQTRRPRTR
jgi:Tfp pilus assembly protein PilX